MDQILIGLVTEGSTDRRFLNSVVKRTFERLTFECWRDVEILDVVPLTIHKSTFAADVLAAAREGHQEHGINVLCVHADADADTDEDAYNYRIAPALEAVAQHTEALCSNLVPIVPVQMQEAWLLADKALLKRQIDTEMSDYDLGLHRHPEQIADPKHTIENAIRIARQPRTKLRRKDLRIAELYQPIGQSIRLEALSALSSYQKFESNVRTAYRVLNLMR